MSREQKIAETFVELADTLVADFDVIDFLQQMTVRCCDLLAVADTTILLAYPGPSLYSPAPCDPSPALSKVMDLAMREGPALDAYRTATAVTPGNLARAPATWNDFTTQAVEAGYTYASAVPLRLRRQTLGSLLLLRTTDSPLPLADLALAQAFADAATIGLVHARALDHADSVNEQLHTALHSRIVIEQAKGMLAALRTTSLDNAFTTMCRHARHHHLRLTTVAHHIIDTGDLPRPLSPPCSPAGDAPAE
ncbi:ANTAR domain-containing protein [Streptomyces sp. MST-110588]|uniref:ANTAR domain-containing protein n=1 Tax=Streptomyces sp. MST-110588 TaxID=2833628 RepID=UPI001F5C94D4|nr:ANTAR domain-containing protein [Streptomyces sp. MST-110588]UNO43568.1 ANTAR domain-containing protein [Streptomyces sp. MST-110588]